jgi:F-type H+-transporting ATPase subunit delta
MQKTNLILAKRYAKALLTSNIDESQKRLDDLLELNKKLKAVKGYFLNPAISKKVKKELLGKMHSKKNYGLKLVGFLIEAGRFNILDAIIECYYGLLLDLKNIQTAEVFVTEKPDKFAMDKIKKFIENRTAKKIEIKFILKPEIAGGFQIKTGDSFIDASVIGGLKRLNKNLRM